MHGSSNLTSAFLRAPLLRAAIPFILGLLLARAFVVPLFITWGIVLLLAGTWAFLAFRKQEYRKRWQQGVALYLLLFTFGALWQRLHAEQLRADHLGNFLETATGWEVEVTEVASVGERTFRAWTEVEAGFVDGTARPASGRMLITLLRDSTKGTPRNGDRLVLASPAEKIDRIPDPGGFDVGQWAASRGVYHECFAPAERWDFRGGRSAKAGIFEHAQEQISRWLHKSNLPDRERALAKAILLGLRDELEPDQNQAWVRSGTIHALAVSGSHVGIIYIAVLWGLAFLGHARWGKFTRGCVALITLWLYAGLTGFSPSVLRATVTFSLFTVAEMVSWRTEPLNSLACAAGVLLLWDPSMITQLGFQLSFLAVLGIAVFYRPVHLLWAPSTMAGRFFWSLLVVSLVAQAFTLPLCFYVFQAFPVWFLPANMAIVGLVGVGVYGGIVLLVVHSIPVLGAFIGALMTWLLLLLGWLSAFFSGLPAAYPAVRIDLWGMAGLYALLACFAIWLLQHKVWARMATLTILAVLLFGWGWTAHQRNGQREFAVYTDRDGTTCAFVTGRTMHVFSEGANVWAERSIENHARSTGVDHVVRVDSLPKSVKWAKGSYAFVPVGRSNALADNGDLHGTIVLHGDGWLDGKALEQAEMNGANSWVLAADLKSHPRRKAQKLLEHAGRAVHDIREAGAYVRPR